MLLPSPASCADETFLLQLLQHGEERVPAASGPAVRTVQVRRRNSLRRADDPSRHVRRVSVQPAVDDDLVLAERPPEARFQIAD